MKAKLKTLLCGAVMLSILAVSSPLAFAHVGDMSDIDGHWAEKEIKEGLAKGLVGKYADGTFKPDENITRAEFIVLINKAFGLTEKAEVKFDDVSAGTSLEDEVAKAIKAGYIKEAGSGIFKPENAVDRITAAKAIAILLKPDAADGTDALKQFKDIGGVSEDDKSALNEVVKKNYFKGRPDGSIRPLEPITRAEAVVVASRVLADKAPVVQPEQEFKGILIEESCSGTEDPTTHKKECLLMPGCASSGYGIDVKQADGKYIFYKFDENGHNLAKQNIIDKTSKQDNITIVVTGIPEGNIIKVSAISEGP